MFKDLCGERDPHYIYCLVDRPTKHIGYFGVTNDPVKRKQDHLYEYRHPYEKHGRSHGGRMRKWVEKFGRPPELVVLVVCPSRIVAEIMERCLIQRFTAVGQIVSNEYKYWNTSQMAQQMEVNDIPFWELDPAEHGWSIYTAKNLASVGARRKDP
jgi:predicted GIY-YIG superfamily endonuclease